MIIEDMKANGSSDYQLLDEVTTNPNVIEVGANEVVYVIYCYVKTIDNFEIDVTSGTATTNYHNQNTKQQAVGNESIYESSQITAHWSNVELIANLKGHFFIRYVRVIFSKMQ
jgi:Ulp1 family protease